MRNFYATIGDIAISYGSFIEGADEQRLPIKLERIEGKEVAAFAKAIAPNCELVRSEGFDEFELEALRSLLQRNLPLLWDDALEAAAGKESKARGPTRQRRAEAASASPAGQDSLLGEPAEGGLFQQRHILHRRLPPPPLVKAAWPPIVSEQPASQRRRRHPRRRAEVRALRARAGWPADGDL